MTEYFPSHYVDRFWKQLMVQDDTYERFGYEFVRGYIHRDIDNNPISFRPFDEFEEENPLSHRGFGKKKHDAFIRYKRTRRHIIRDKDIIKPFFNLWPKYPSQSGFFTELKYEVTIRQSTIYDIINFIDHQYQSEPDLLKSHNYVFQLADLTAQTQARFTQASDEIHLKPYIKNKTNDNKLGNHAYNPQKQFEMLLYHKFPSSFAETLMNKFLIEGVTASRWIIEYLKFIGLGTLSKRELFPSDIVDKVWHLHMTYSKHYRNMIYSIKGQVGEHTQEGCHKVDDGDQKQTYEDTLSFYSGIFEEPPPEDIWRSPDDEFSPNKDRFVNANLYRLTVMHYMKNGNPSFLLSTSYIDRRQPRTKVEAMNPKTRNIILRRVRRSHYPYQKDQFNWRRKYRVINEYLTLFDKQYEVGSFDKDRQAKELEKINLDKPNASGLDFIVGGGLAILMNIFNDKYLK